MIYDENGKARIDRNGRKPIHLHAVAEKMSIPMHNTEVDCICCGRKQKLHLFPGGKGFYCPACHVSGNDILFYLMNKTGQEPAILMEMLINGTLDERAVVDKFYKDMGSEGKIPFAVKTIQVKKVDVDNVELSERNLTYNAFLNKLKISTEHERNLIERGLRRSDIIANNYKTVPKIGFSKIAADLRKESYNLEGVPGFFKKDGLWSVKKTLPGFLFLQETFLTLDRFMEISKECRYGLMWYRLMIHDISGSQLVDLKMEVLHQHMHMFQETLIIANTVS